VRALVERTGMDRAKLNALMNFKKPPPQAWPCEPSLAHLYLPAGIVSALPKEQLPPDVQAHVAEAERGMRRALRGSGSTVPVETAGKVEVIPVKAQCAGGKLDGPVEYYVAYTLRREQKGEHFSPLTQRLETFLTVMDETMEVLMSQEYKAGKPAGHSRALRRGSMKSGAVMDTPEAQKRWDQSMAQIGMDRPTAVWSATFSQEDGVVTMNPVPSAEVSAGFWAPKAKLTEKFGVMVLITRGNVLETDMFSDGHLSSQMRMNKTTGNMVSVTNMDNFLKATGQKLADLPNMENYREVTIGGRNLLQMTTCMVDMKPAKLDPCPVE
jgi:hypothetical protein